jgi:hypothetical protein
MPNVVESADVRVIQTGNCFGFALETLVQFSTIDKKRGENFDGDNSVQTVIASLVNSAHSARANGGEDFIGADRLTG